MQRKNLTRSNTFLIHTSDSIIREAVGSWVKGNLGCITRPYHQKPRAGHVTQWLSICLVWERTWNQSHTLQKRVIYISETPSQKVIMYNYVQTFRSVLGEIVIQCIGKLASVLSPPSPTRNWLMVFADFHGGNSLLLPIISFQYDY